LINDQLVNGQAGFIDLNMFFRTRLLSSGLIFMMHVYFSELGNFQTDKLILRGQSSLKETWSMLKFLLNSIQKTSIIYFAGHQVQLLEPGDTHKLSKLFKLQVD
jgi:hypothetical protein